MDDSTAHLELIRATAINAFHFFLGVYLYVEGLGSTVPCRGSRVTIFFFIIFFSEKWKTNGKQIRRI